MGKKGGKLVETPVYLGTTDVEKAQSQRFRRIVALVLVFCVDLLCSLALYIVAHVYTRGWSDFWAGILSFTGDTSDLVLLCVLRIAVCSALTWFASGCAWTEAENKERRSRFGGEGRRKLPDRRKVDEQDLSVPLLGSSSDRNVGVAGSGTGPDAASRSKDILLFLVFLCCTGFQAYVGAKCLEFEYDATHTILHVRVALLEEIFMGLFVVCINLESSLVSRVVDANRVLSRALHLKSLSQRALNHTGPNTSNGAQSALEGILRGDRGLRVEMEVDQNTYLLRAISLAKEEACLILCAFLFLGFSSFMSMVLPHLQGQILDSVIGGAVSVFKRDVVLLVVFSVFTGVFEAVRNLCFAVVGKRVLKTLQDRLFMGIIIQDIAYFDSTTSGELSSRLTNDVSSMAEPLNWMLSSLVRNLISLVGGFVMCFIISWKLSMLAFTTMAPIMHITAVYSRWSRELNRKRYAVLAEANSVASEALGNVRTVRAFSTEDVEIDRFKSKTHAAMKKGVRDAYAYAGAVAVNDWLDLGASVLILWYGGVLVMREKLSMGKLITFQLYWNLIQSGYKSIMSVLMSLTRAAGAAQRVLSLVDALPDIDPHKGTSLASLDGDIKLENVHFHYQMRPQHRVLNGVSLHVGKGEVCALVGRSGGGKSTIVHLLMRFYDPTQGRILLDNWDLRDLNLKSAHKHIGLVAQDTQMFACSIFENMTYGLTRTLTQEEVEEAARLANAHDFIMRFPEGYATRVGERGVRVSGGQRQRIAIARMLLRRPKVLLLDEATSALDTESEALVQQALDRLMVNAEGGRPTIVLVAHRLSTVRNADVIAVMEKGAIVERGTHDELLDKSGVYERLVRRQLYKNMNRIMDDPLDGDDATDIINSLLDGDISATSHHQDAA